MSRNGVFGVLTAIASIVFAVIVVEWGLRLYEGSVRAQESMDDGFVLFDRQLGWRLSPGWEGRHRHWDFDVVYKVNSQGFRGKPVVRGRDDRVFFLGDSFTFGLGVNEGETFTDQLNSQFTTPGIEFSNFGIPGYATDQQLLLLDRVLRYEPATLVWVVYLGNDLLDNRYPYPIQAEYGKPYFELEEGKLVARNTPVPLGEKKEPYRGITLPAAILGENGPLPHWRSRLNETQLGQRFNSLLGLDEVAVRVALDDSISADVQLFMAMMRQAQALLASQGAKLHVVLMPGSGYFRAGSIPGIYQTRLEELLENELVLAGYPSTSLGKALGQVELEGVQPLFYPNDGHLTAYGHKVVAEILSREHIW